MLLLYLQTTFNVIIVVVDNSHFPSYWLIDLDSWALVDLSTHVVFNINVFKWVFDLFHWHLNIKGVGHLLFSSVHFYVNPSLLFTAAVQVNGRPRYFFNVPVKKPKIIHFKEQNIVIEMQAEIKRADLNTDCLLSIVPWQLL